MQQSWGGEKENGGMEVGRQEKWQAEQKGRVGIDGRACRDREPLCWKLWPPRQAAQHGLGSWGAEKAATGGAPSLVLCSCEQR